MATYDLTSQAFNDDPFPTYRKILAEAPIHWSESVGGWYVARYADVAAGLRDPRLSTDRFTPMMNMLPEAVKQKFSHITRIASKWTLMLDPPEHTRLRAMTGDSFSTRALDAYRPRVEAVVDEVLGRTLAAGRMDVVRDLAHALPLSVIANLIGVSRDFFDQFAQWFQPCNELFSKSAYTDEHVAAATDGLLKMEAYLEEIVEARRREPTNDIISHFIALPREKALSDEGIVAECILLLSAGQETAKTVIPHAVLTLLEHPEALDRLRRSPELLKGAIEEILRRDPPMHKLGRVALEDMDICGQRIAKGDLVWLGIATANRDPAEFADPDRFDIDRKDNRHLAFGYGIHFCEGAGLARVELRLLLERLIALPELKLAVPRSTLTCVGGNHMRELTSLPITFQR